MCLVTLCLAPPFATCRCPHGLQCAKGRKMDHAVARSAGIGCRCDKARRTEAPGACISSPSLG